MTDAVLSAFAARSWPTVEESPCLPVSGRAVCAQMRSQAGLGGSLVQRAAGRPSVDLRVLDRCSAGLQTLSPQQRAFVYLTYWEDLSPRQIAE
ncbi:MAG: hypothetical protein R2705_13415 [Ilumatobacteraceae bacterium]